MVSVSLTEVYHGFFMVFSGTPKSLWVNFTLGSENTTRKSFRVCQKSSSFGYHP